MAEFVPLYHVSFSEAQELEVLDEWRASHAENVRCRDYISQSIDLNYDGTRLGGDIAGHAIALFGYDRTNWVLANTIQQYGDDGRISDENRAWAEGIYISRGKSERDYRQDYAVRNHPGLVDLVARDARQAWDALHLFGAGQCDSIYDFETVEGRVLVLKPEVLMDEYKRPEDQLFLVI